MPILQAVASRLGLAKREAPANPAMLPGIIPPSRSDASRLVTVDRAVTHSTIYRAFQIMTTSAIQVSVHVERNNQRVPSEQVPSYIKKPCLDMTRTEFIEYTVTSMMATGDAFWLKNYGPAGELLDVTPLNPNHVHVAEDPKSGRKRFSYKGTTYTAADIVQISLLKLPGALRGLGPIQAAQTEIGRAHV